MEQDSAVRLVGQSPTFTSGQPIRRYQRRISRWTIAAERNREFAVPDKRTLSGVPCSDSKSRIIASVVRCWGCRTRRWIRWRKPGSATALQRREQPGTWRRRGGGGDGGGANDPENGPRLPTVGSHLIDGEGVCAAASGTAVRRRVHAPRRLASRERLAAEPARCLFVRFVRRPLVPSRHGRAGTSQGHDGTVRGQTRARARQTRKRCPSWSWEETEQWRDGRPRGPFHVYTKTVVRVY